MKFFPGRSQKAWLINITSLSISRNLHIPTALSKHSKALFVYNDFSDQRSITHRWPRNQSAYSSPAPPVWLVHSPFLDLLFRIFFFFIVRYAYHHCLIGRIVDIWFWFRCFWECIFWMIYFSCIYHLLIRGLMFRFDLVLTLTDADVKYGFGEYLDQMIFNKDYIELFVNWLLLSGRNSSYLVDQSNSRMKIGYFGFWSLTYLPLARKSFFCSSFTYCLL